MKNINTEEFKTLLTSETKPIVVDFYTTWCPPCKLLAPILEKLSKELTDTTFVKIDCDREEALSDEYKIESVPTLCLFKEGKLLSTQQGALPIAKLKEWIQSNTNQADPGTEGR